MSFRVEPAALRTYAGQLLEAKRVAEAAHGYVNRYGNFSFHEQGLIGYAAPGHRRLLADLNELLTHLGDLSTLSAEAMGSVAARYEQSDLSAESRVDASYPAAPRGPMTRD